MDNIKGNNVNKSLEKIEEEKNSLGKKLTNKNENNINLTKENKKCLEKEIPKSKKDKENELEILSENPLNKNIEEEKEILIDEVLDRKNNLQKLQKDSGNLKYINALHKYNEVKDIAQEILGYLSNCKNISIKELYQDLDISDDDKN